MKIFDQGSYENSEEALHDLYMNHSYAHAKVSRRAVVEADSREAHVWYAVKAGVPGVFGNTRVIGTRNVATSLVLRELADKKGEAFDARKVAISRTKYSGAQAPAMPQVALEAALSYRNVNQPAELNLDSLKLATPTSSASLTGKVVFTQTYGIDVLLKLDRLTPQDLARLVPSYSLRDDLSGNVALKGPANALHVEAQIGAGRASLEATIDSDLTRATPAFGGKVALSRFDLAKLTIAQELNGVINAVVAARCVGRRYREAGG